MNGDVSCSAGQSGALEETLQQMNILIQENRDLKGESRCGSELKKMCFYLSFLFCFSCTIPQ